MRLNSHFSHTPQKAIPRKAVRSLVHHTASSPPRWGKDHQCVGAVIEYHRQECGVGLADPLKHGGNTNDGADEDISQTHDAQIGGTVCDHLLAETQSRILARSWHGIHLIYLDNIATYWRVKKSVIYSNRGNWENVRY